MRLTQPKDEILTSLPGKNCEMDQKPYSDVLTKHTLAFRPSGALEGGRAYSHTHNHILFDYALR